MRPSGAFPPYRSDTGMSEYSAGEQPSRFSRRALAGGLAATGVGALAMWGAGPAEANTDPSVYSVDVKDHGAKGDGVTDDSDAIKAAVTAAIAGRSNGIVKKEVFFPPGNYKVTRAPGTASSASTATTRPTTTASTTSCCARPTPSRSTPTRSCTAGSPAPPAATSRTSSSTTSCCRATSPWPAATSSASTAAARST
ncbi:glycosyl hydrolase family 28-related protein [Nonomuraea sp. NPDC002799]